ncbi:MAG: hypothetical protein ABW122_00595 [Ilumatobacteraceae bacterium]
MPACVPQMAQSGLVVHEAARIEVPLFLAAGERDVLEDLATEPTAFRACDDVTLFRLRRSAHMHNFAATREILWDRLHQWFETQVGWRQDTSSGSVVASASSSPPTSTSPGSSPER